MAVALALAAGAARADVPLSFYGDVGYQFTHERAFANAFQVQRLDLFASQSVERFTFLAEVLFEASLETNAFALDVERVEVGYQLSPALRVRAGRFHTALGYYNDAFHHGTYFLVPVSRPQAVDFEDAGGLLPSHAIGLHVDGRFAVGEAARLRFDLEVFNGRGGPDVVTNVVDVNKGKAVNLRLRLEPQGALDGLVLGVNGAVDQLEPRPDHPDDGRATEVLLGAHAAYLESPWHFVAEAWAIAHLGLADRWTLAGFVEAGHAIDDVTPYVRLEATRYPATEDPFFAGPQATGDRLAALAGARWLVSDHVALKLEAGWARTALPSPLDRLALRAQAAFAF